MCAAQWVPQSTVAGPLMRCGFQEVFDFRIQVPRDSESIRVCIGGRKTGHPIVRQMHAVGSLVNQNGHRSIGSSVGSISVRRAHKPGGGFSRPLWRARIGESCACWQLKESAYRYAAGDLSSRQAHTGASLRSISVSPAWGQIGPVRSLKSPEPVGLSSAYCETR